jgi:hypothetical protein
VSAHVKVSLTVAIACVLAFVLWGVGRKILVVQGVLRDEEAGPLAKLVLFALFFVFSLSLVPLILHGFLAAQGRIGNADLGPVRAVRDHQFRATLIVWGLMTAGMAVALPVMWNDFFGFASPAATPTHAVKPGADPDHK